MYLGVFPLYTESLAKFLRFILNIQVSFLYILKVLQILIIGTLCISFSKTLSLPSTTRQSFLKFMSACVFCHWYGANLFLYIQHFLKSS